MTRTRVVHRDRVEGKLRVVADIAEMQWQDDAEFIAFCGTERDRILEALRIAEVVKAQTQDEALSITQTAGVVRLVQVHMPILKVISGEDGEAKP
jgi:capsid portal protein